MRNFRNYEIWQKSIELTTAIYELSKKFPSQEKFALANQIERAAVSIPSNIAEGASRSSEVDFARFLEISLGSAFEVETQLLIAQKLDYIAKEEYHCISTRLDSLQKQLGHFISKIKHPKLTAKS